MRLRLKRGPSPESAERPARDTVASTDKGSRVSQRRFLKLVGAAMGIGLATRFATPAERAFASNVGDPDAYLQGSLYGPSAAPMKLISQLQNSQTAEVTQFFVQQPNGSGGYNQLEAVAISNNGNVRVSVGSISVDNGSITIVNGNLSTQGFTSQWVGGTRVTGTLDMGNQSLTNVASIWSFPNRGLVLGGWQNIDLNPWNGHGSFRWWGGTGTPQVVMDSTGKVGIGTSSPIACLTVVAQGSSVLLGSAASTLLSTTAGSLGSAASAELALTSIGFLSGGNNVSLGVRAIRTSSGSGWDTSAIGLGMDVDNTVRAGPCIWLSANGNVGIANGTFGSPFAPSSALHLRSGQFQIGSTVVADGSGCYYA